MTTTSRTDMLAQIAHLEREVEQLKRALVTESGEARPLAFPFDALVARVAGLYVAFPVAAVQEVIPMVWVTPLPQAPDVIRGIVHFRGQLVPLLDLGFALSGARQALAPHVLIAVVAAAERLYGLTADEVFSVRRFDATDAAGTPTRGLAPFVRGLLRSDGDTIMVMDPTRLLAAGEQSLLTELLRETPPDTQERP